MLVEVTVNGLTYHIAAASTLAAVVHVLEQDSLPEYSAVSIVAKKVGSTLQSIAPKDNDV